ncbi:MAG: hypothetical protein ACPGXK_16935 [Phycisphaerae bacterium]
MNEQRLPHDDPRDPVDMYDGGESGCPKEPWILECLLDDENPVEERTWSHAVTFHLKRCASCRDLANRVNAVVGGLQEMGQAPCDEQLLGQANARVLASLGLTQDAMVAVGGGVSESGASDVSEAEPARGVPAFLLRHRAFAFAAAAMLGLVCLATFQLIDGGGDGAAESVPVATSPQNWPFEDVFPDVPEHQRNGAGDSNALPETYKTLDALFAERGAVASDGDRSEKKSERVLPFGPQRIRRDLLLDFDSPPEYGSVQPAYTFSPYHGTPVPSDRE